MLLSILDHGPCFNSQKTNLTSLYRHKPACHLSKKKNLNLKKEKYQPAHQYTNLTKH